MNTPKSQTRDVAEKVLSQGLPLINSADEKTLPALSRALIEAAQTLDALPSGAEVSRSDRVRQQREKRLGQTQTG